MDVGLFLQCGCAIDLVRVTVTAVSPLLCVIARGLHSFDSADSEILVAVSNNLLLLSDHL